MSHEWKNKYLNFSRALIAVWEVRAARLLWRLLGLVQGSRFSSMSHNFPTLSVRVVCEVHLCVIMLPISPALTTFIAWTHSREEICISLTFHVHAWLIASLCRFCARARDYLIEVDLGCIAIDRSNSKYRVIWLGCAFPHGWIWGELGRQ